MCIRDRSHDGKGITISKGIGKENPHITLSWSQVVKRIGELISMDRYLNPEEKEHYPRWLESQEERRAKIAETKEIVRYSLMHRRNKRLNQPKKNLKKQNSRKMCSMNIILVIRCKIGRAHV